MINPMDFVGDRINPMAIVGDKPNGCCNLASKCLLEALSNLCWFSFMMILLMPMQK
jgi:hypothetical protein